MDGNTTTSVSRTRVDGGLRRNPSRNKKYVPPAFDSVSPEQPNKRRRKPESLGSKAYTPQKQALQPEMISKSTDTPSGRIHRKPRLSEAEKLQLLDLFPLGELRCIVTLIPPETGLNDVAHIMPRASPDHKLLLVELNIGLLPRSLNVDTSQNLTCMSKDMHSQFDNGHTTWIMLDRVLYWLLQKIILLRTLPLCQRRDHLRLVFEPRIWEYDVISLTDHCPHIVRHNLDAAPEMIDPPYKIRIQSQVHPLFVFINTCAKIKRWEKKDPEWRIPYEHRGVLSSMAYAWNWFWKIPEWIVQAFSDRTKHVFDNFDWDTLEFEGINLSEQSASEDEGDHASSSSRPLCLPIKGHRLSRPVPIRDDATTESSQSPSPPPSPSPNRSRKGCIKCARLVNHRSATEAGLSDSSDFPIMEPPPSATASSAGN
ncbi:uncharacterized protein LAESUDRAFT_715767 [Laetiporus sulphureus 93-53]|uniref:HNH nuclease domain-containing protein n=1 Tax=Laetiporus sulphureus 93-53 TaxID=1314785 RepID=A0A165D6H4_9APHY|nr:uncharacterized protein LAESUDRAFT_715767 [Laetiporus sulphureus 93-53]KZT04243.1 hypothetical protein LAESUDRAFT_715767 [Laetiporus sulphureus 93-53]